MTLAALVFSRHDDPVRLSPASRRAVGAGLELRSTLGGELVAIHSGPSAGRTALREALALGCDRGIHVIVKDEFDTFALSEGARHALGSMDVRAVVVGAGDPRVAGHVASALDAPVIGGITGLKGDAQSLTATSSTGRAALEIVLAPPAVFVVSERRRLPPPPIATGIEQAFKDKRADFVQSGAAGHVEVIGTVHRDAETQGPIETATEARAAALEVLRTLSREGII